MQINYNYFVENLYLIYKYFIIVNSIFLYLLRVTTLLDQYYYYFVNYSV